MTLSEFEDRFLALIDEAGLSRPVPNAPVLGERRDHVWPEARLVVELDSRQYHDTRWAFDGDRARDRALQVAGWRTIRITWRQLVTDPRGIVRDLQTLLNERDSRLPRIARQT